MPRRPGRRPSCAPRLVLVASRRNGIRSWAFSVLATGSSIGEVVVPPGAAGDIAGGVAGSGAGETVVVGTGVSVGVVGVLGETEDTSALVLGGMAPRGATAASVPGAHAPSTAVRLQETRTATAVTTGSSDALGSGVDRTPPRPLLAEGAWRQVARGVAGWQRRADRSSAVDAVGEERTVTEIGGPGPQKKPDARC